MLINIPIPICLIYNYFNSMVKSNGTDKWSMSSFEVIAELQFICVTNFKSVYSFFYMYDCIMLNFFTYECMRNLYCM